MTLTRFLRALDAKTRTATATEALSEKFLDLGDFDIITKRTDKVVFIFSTAKNRNMFFEEKVKNKEQPVYVAPSGKTSKLSWDFPKSRTKRMSDEILGLTKKLLVEKFEQQPDNTEPQWKTGELFMVDDIIMKVMVKDDPELSFHVILPALRRQRQEIHRSLGARR